MTRIGLWLGRFLHHHFPTAARDAYCSFCGRSYQDAGPFAEGPAGAMICGNCVRACSELIARKVDQRPND